MASPQTENGHARVANELLEAVIRFPFTASQLRVVLWIVRNTYGWSRRKTEVRGLRKISDETKIPRASVALALQVLIEAGVVVREDKDGGHRYGLNKNYDEWIEQAAGLLPLSNGLDRVSKPLDTKKPRKVSNPLDTSSNPLDRSVQPIGHPYKELKKDLKKDLNSGVDAALTPLQKVVRGFKEAKGIDADDREWDRLHFARFARAAKDLLGIFQGNAEAAIVYTLTKGEEWREKLPSWGLEAVARNAATDPRVMELIQKGVDHGPENGAVDAARVDGPGRRGRLALAGELAGDALEGLRRQAAVPDQGPRDVAGQPPDLIGDGETFA